MNTKGEQAFFLLIKRDMGFKKVRNTTLNCGEINSQARQN